MHVTDTQFDTTVKHSKPSTMTKAWNLKTGRRITTVSKGGIIADTNRLVTARSLTKKLPCKCFLENGVSKMDTFKQIPSIVSRTSTIGANIFNHIGQYSSAFMLETETDCLSCWSSLASLRAFSTSVCVPIKP